MSIQDLKIVFLFVCFGFKKKLVIHSKASHGLQGTPLLTFLSENVKSINKT